MKRDRGTLQEGAEADLLTSGFFCLFSYTIKVQLPRVRTNHKDLVPPTSVVNQENSPTGLPTGDYDGGIFSIKVASSLMTLACIQLVKSNQCSVQWHALSFTALLFLSWNTGLTVMSTVVTKYLWHKHSSGLIRNFCVPQYLILHLHSFTLFIEAEGNLSCDLDMPTSIQMHKILPETRW